MRLLGWAAKVLFAAFFVVAGINHFVETPFYVRMMPPYLPWPLALVWISGLAEIALGIALVVPRTSRLAAWGLVALLLAVYPANIQMALHPEAFPEFSPVMLWLRLPLQFVLLAWAYAYTRPRAAAGTR